MESFSTLFGSLLALVYHCFDRIVIQGYLPLLTRPEHIVHFFRDVHGIAPITKQVLAQRTTEYKEWVEAFARDHGVPIAWADVENDGLRLHRGSRLDQDPLDPPIGRRGDPADLLRHQRSEPPHLAYHRPALDGVWPQRRGFDAGRGRFQTRQADADQDDDEQARARIQRAADPLLSDIGRRSSRSREEASGSASGGTTTPSCGPLTPRRCKWRRIA